MIAGVGTWGARPARWGDELARADHRREPLLVMAVVFALSLAARALGGAAVGLAVVWAPLVVHYTFVAKPHDAARVYLTLALFLEPPELVPGCGYWVSPLDGANRVFYDSIKNVTGLPGASVPLSLVVALVLLVRAERAPKPVGWVKPLPFARAALAGYVGALGALFAWGLLRGGALEPAFRQALHMATFGVVASMFLRAFRGRDDLFRLGTMIVAVAVVRAGLVAWVYLVICRPQGIEPAFCTTHADSVTFDVALLVLFAHAVEARTRRAVLRLVGFGAVLVVAMVMNNRRLAFVGAGAGAAAIVAALPKSRERTRVLRALVPLGVLFAAYVALADGTTSPVFAPGRLVLSSIAQSDTSADSRVVENENLIVTFRENPVLGSGFGFEYVEVQKVYDISEFFPYYRYIPHNSVLWLLTVGGIVGFYFLWAPYVAMIFASVRAHGALATPTERAAALVGLGIAVVAMVNDWGDQGRNDVINVMMLAAGYAFAAKLAPAPPRLRGPALALSGPRTPDTRTRARGSRS